MAAIQSPFQATAGTAASLNVLTTAGDMLIENATPANARLPVGAANQMIGISAGAPAWLSAFTLQAATAVAGYSMINGTGTIITWTPPNDGKIHPFLIIYESATTVNATGGTASFSWTAPNGTSRSGFSVDGGSHTAGTLQTPNFPTYAISEANQAVTLTQDGALTAGTVLVFAQIWGA